MRQLIPNGYYLLSGIGHTTIKDEYHIDEDIEVDLFCLNGVTYGAYIDPYDGYRSYGIISPMENGVKCQYTFSPQPVRVKNEEVKNSAGNLTDKELIKIIDAVNKKEVLVVGTDYSEDYYPYAIFNYTPENLEINRNR